MALATACPPSAADRTAALLGMEVEKARGVVAELLAEEPVSCRVPLGAWYAPRLASPELEALARSAPTGADAGSLPSPGALDQWVRASTLDLFEQLPLRLDPLLAYLVVSLVAARAQWRTPFEVISSLALGPGPFAGTVEGSLWTPPGHDHRVAVVDTVAAGRVGLHQVTDVGGLLATSLIAPDDVDRLDVLAAAREVAAGGGTEVDPTELELGDSPMWSIAEEQVPSPGDIPGPLPHLASAHLPAWSADTTINLLDDKALGLVDLADSILDLLPPHLRANATTRAEQGTRARFHATGFEAASITEQSAPPSTTPNGQHLAVRRHLTIRFGRPYAVVATDTTVPAWSGLPLYCGWITEPDNAAEGSSPD
jgi:hypothetical protein